MQESFYVKAAVVDSFLLLFGDIKCVPIKTIVSPLVVCLQVC